MSDYFEEEGSARANERKETRWNIPIPVFVKGTGKDGKDFEEETITADASPSGMCLLLTVEPERGAQVHVTAPEEGFESPATVTSLSALGPGMHRVRLRFPKEKQFGRAAAAKKYVYDFNSDTWVGYLLEGTYYNSKHEPFGRVDKSQIISLDTGRVLFTLRWDALYDVRGNCLGHIL
jgi:hypothetical protein